MEIKIEDSGEIICIDEVARQANGSILYKKGKAVLLSSVVIDSKSVEGDFLPLTVQYLEKSYANAKFPGGYIKREGKPNEFEVLTSRLIDRSLRPLFPKGFCYPIQITIFVLSIDRELDLQVLALNAASLALYISDIPINVAVNSLRVGLIKNELIINPTLDLLQESDIDLYISGEGDNIFMIEFKSNNESLCEDKLLEVLELAKNHIKTTSYIYERYLKDHIKPPKILQYNKEYSSDIFNTISTKYKNELESCFVAMSKSENNTMLDNIKEKIIAENTFDELGLEVAIVKFKRNFIRNKILLEEKRLDGRGLDEIRDISILTNILPSAHGSTLFTRGETQVLAVCTIGGDNDMQSYEMLNSKSVLKNSFLFHYNFPSFSTGEAYPITSPSRRELGHGNLARRALESSIKNDNRAIRIVSEVLESNGSSSMASVCGGSLSLYSAGIKPLFLVAGIAMGLVKDGKNYKILTDIMGIEDYDGDMDFKVAGNEVGITALQMDIKINDIDINILKDALLKAREARLKILSLMVKARDNIILGDNIPQVESFCIPINKIPSVIGHGGKNIKNIIDKFNINIDIAKDSGIVRLSSISKQNLLNAKEYILSIVNINLDSINVGDKFNGKIKRIVDFGMFVEIKDGIDGLIHNSKLLKNNINLSDYKEGDILSVEVVAINNDKIELFIS
ncbi:polyribonucleotide nucleotidyltransferase [Helicobacter sp. MIT 14-3879]|uniref:polyribonucleotide nucleotidyltransferase n=1 Tax=Helicobacter sp. MIT 14-3879 TaxID=2040649 RepID=UPI000E1EC288|nr:polyribonucleotide nucleotidyltransferase [Helicobacter sp. MIT 14-3879]RDU64146.1 polyribonucleotide nucleotidyltransferase [Helicobacter sp. MIT 14-3879]